MSDYDFHTLSPIDFENLVRDLLQAELSIRLETFKTGKDGGIDLRYSQSSKGSLIVQAKHYRGAGFSRLLSHLKLKEKPKIHKLRPSQYVLATSVSLSPANKAAICEVLKPHIERTQDIYGKDDLNNLLGLYQNIERRHFKLWLSSSTILDRIIHSEVLNQSEITLGDIRDKARIYVTNDSFGEALEILNEYGYVIIAGIPGIGKTMLAKMLVLHFLREDYQFIDVSHDISEAYGILHGKRRQVFLYDDFLGRTSIAEKLRKNEDHRLLKFINSLRNRTSVKLILTTREYLLRQAQETYEVLDTPLLDKPQCIVDLSHYTRPIRAKILYNHLYFSKLPKPHIKEIVSQKTYLEILDHPNYNPRILEYMTDHIWVDSDHPESYPKDFLRNLKEPYQVWDQAFHNHLSKTSRQTLVVLATLPREIFVEDLQRAVEAFLRDGKIEFSQRQFHRALSELEGNFVTFTRDRGNDIVSFHNPSVQDFVDSYIEKNPGYYKSLLDSAYFFEQVYRLCQRVANTQNLRQLQEEIQKAFTRTFSASPCTLITYSYDEGRYSVKGRDKVRPAMRLSYLASLLQKDDFSFLERFFQNRLYEFTKQLPNLSLYNHDLFLLAESIIALGKRVQSDDFFEATKEALFSEAYWLRDVSYISKLMDLRPQIFTTEDRERIRETISNIIANNLVDEDAEHLSDELSALRKIQDKHGLSLQDQVAQVEELIAEADELEDFAPDFDEYLGDREDEEISDETLAEMFSTLLP